MARGKKRKEESNNTNPKYQTLISSFDNVFFVSILFESTSLPCKIIIIIIIYVKMQYCLCVLWIYIEDI
jgi:hypothetical protein